MGYPKEIQHEYNQKYYAANKSAITAKQATKEPCKYCGRYVRHDNIWKHTTSTYCINRRALISKLPQQPVLSRKKAAYERIDALMKNIERLYHETELIYSAAKPFQHFKFI